MIKVSAGLWGEPPLPAPAGGSMTPQVPHQPPSLPAISKPASPPLGASAAPPIPTSSAPRPIAPPIPTAPGPGPTSQPIPTGPTNPYPPIAPPPRPAAPTIPTAESQTPGTQPWTFPKRLSFTTDINNLDALPPAIQKLIPTRAKMDYLKDTVGTEARPPLSYATDALGDFKPQADKALGWIQNQLRGKDGPQTFASMAGLAGKGVMEPLLNTPFGLPLLAGGYGLLRGGDSFAAAHKLFGPALARLGITGGGTETPPTPVPAPPG